MPKPQQYDRTPISTTKWAETRAEILARVERRTQAHADIFEQRRTEAARQNRRTMQLNRMRRSGRHMGELPVYPPISAWERQEITGGQSDINIDHRE